MAKVTLNFADEMAQVLEEMARKKGVTVTQIIREALGTEVYFEKARQEGNKVLLESPDGKQRELIFK